MSSRLPAALCGLIAILALGGCYASTEPATDIGPESATLNARGTADKGPATSHFEYRLTGSSRPPFKTVDRHWPAGASAPFHESLTGLAAGTSYSFRVCGSDDSAGGSICAQTRAFTTKPPVEDAAMGDFNNGTFHGVVNAHSGPNGANAHGTVLEQQSGRTTFEGSVTCLYVGSNDAAIGAVGTSTYLDGTKSPAARVWTVVDGRLQRDTVNSVSASPDIPPTCEGASFAHQLLLLDTEEIVVNDAQEGTPTSAR